MTTQQVILAVLGLVALAAFGSFVCVIIDRLPKALDEPNEFGEHYEMQPWSEVLGGHSRCSSCGTTVRAWQNVPILSWVLLRGRCSGCGERIPAFHPVVEFAVPAVSAAIVWGNGWSWALLPFLVLVPIGVAIAVIDWRTFMVPTRLVWPGFALTVLASGVTVLVEGEARWLLGGLVGVAILAGPLFALFWVLPGGMGFGDVRLAVLLGWILGFAAVSAGGSLPSAVILVLAMLVGASMLGIVIGVGVAMFSSTADPDTPFRKRRVPFGPMLVTATFAALVFVQSFVEPFI